MKLLIDTHTFLWWSILDPKLSPKIQSLIENIENEILFSAASAWEISIKYQLEKIILPTTPEIFIQEQLDKNNIQVLPVNLLHALAIRNLPLYHKDPFDRMLVAQAKVENIPILSRDPKLKEYGIEVIW